MPGACAEPPSQRYGVPRDSARYSEDRIFTTNGHEYGREQTTTDGTDTTDIQGSDEIRMTNLRKSAQSS
jgi:hypothetical protein